MRVTGDTPIAAAEFASPEVVHVHVADERPGTDIGGTPALVGKRQALAPAAGALGRTKASSSCIFRAVQRAVIQR